MPARLQQRILVAIIIGLIVWPIPHYFLTRQIGSDPWKNFGLAMYATRYQVGVRVAYRTVEGDWREMADSVESVLLISRFIEERQARGLFAKPDRLAKELQKLTSGTQLRIFVRSEILDGRRGLMRPLHQRRYDYSFSPGAVARAADPRE